jgi:hypothetical protein
MDHRLLIARLIVRLTGTAFLQGLPHSSNISVPENTKHSRNESAGSAISLTELLL